MSVPEPVPDEFDPERPENRTKARLKADPRYAKAAKGLGGVPAATPEQLSRWDREASAKGDRAFDAGPVSHRQESGVPSHDGSHGTADVQPSGSTVSPSHSRRTRDGETAAFAHRRFDPSHFQPIGWAWKGRLVRKVLNLFVGDEGIGKGTIEAWVIAALTKGELPGDLEGRPARVLWIGDEDAAEDVVGPRLYAAGADFAHVEEVYHPHDALLNVTTDADEFERLLRSGPFDVVAFEALLDNLPPMHHPNDPQELRSVLHPLKAVLRRTGTTGCATLHTIKARALDFRSKMAGSHQFNAVARSGLLVAHHPDGSARRVLIGGKANYTAGAVPLSFAIRGHLFQLNGRDFDQPLATDFEEEPDLTMEDVLGGPPGKRERQQTERVELVLSALTDTPQSVRAVATKIELSASTTGRYLADLVDDGLATQTGKGFVLATQQEEDT